MIYHDSRHYRIEECYNTPLRFALDRKEQQLDGHVSLNNLGWYQSLAMALTAMAQDVEEQFKMKTYKEWSESGLKLTSFLHLGDLVDEDLANYFRDVLPPACHTSTIRQIGEPYSHINGFPTFMTIEKTPQGWTYRGTCYREKTQHL